MELDVTRTSLEILFSVSRELANSLDLHQVLTRVLVLSTQNMGAERASLVVLNAAAEPVDAAVIFDGVPIAHTVEQMKDVVTSGLAGWVVTHKQPVLVSNTLKDERWLKRPGDTEDKRAAKSALCVPLKAQERLVGVLTIVHPQDNFFSDEQFKLQQAIADLAGIAIRNAQLYEDVQAAHNRYHILFEDSVDPIFITDLNGRIVEANHQAAHTTGIDKPDLVGMAMPDLHEMPLDKVGLDYALIKDSAAVTYESKLLCSKCDRIPVEVYVSSIVIQEKQNFQWIFRDISERKKLDELREDLSAMIYHDLRSPLSNIISSLDILKSMHPQDISSSETQLLDIASRSTERLQRLISSLLDINRLESGQPITDKKNVDVAQLIDDAIETIKPNAKSRGVTVEKLVPGELSSVLVDGDMIRRVLINLLENSIKFSPQKTTINIGAKQSGSQVAVWVEDHGPGILADQREKVFDKFVRFRSEGIVKGLGLGLAFCRLAVQSHGGKIWVENIASGGSRFIFTLPTVN
jgi:PAS domain S-box-containing protein